VYGLGLGVIPGLVPSYIFWHDSMGTSSLTVAECALAAVPIPTITNGIAGGFAAIKIRERLFGRTAA